MPNKRKSSAKNAGTQGGLLSDKTSILLLGIVLSLILCNVVATLFLDTKPNTWLFYFNMRYWSIYVSIALWTAAAWIVSKSTGILENYLPFFRISAVICILFAIIFTLQNAPSTANPNLFGSLFWFNVVVIIAVCCVVRSLFLLYDYQYNEEPIDLEEASWFWGMSGFFLIVLIVTGIMSVISVKVSSPSEAGNFVSIPLLTYCRDGLHMLIQNGQGALAIKALGFLIFVASAVFVYIAGKWMLIFLVKIRGE